MSDWLDKCWWWHRWVFQHRDNDFNWYRCVLCGSWKKTRLLAAARGSG